MAAPRATAWKIMSEKFILLYKMVEALSALALVAFGWLGHLDEVEFVHFEAIGVDGKIVVDIWFELA